MMMRRRRVMVMVKLYALFWTSFFLMKRVIAQWAKTQSFRIRVVDSTRRFRRRCKIFFSAEASPCPMRTRFPSKFSMCNKGLVVDLAQWWGSAPGNFRVCQVCKTFEFDQCSFFKACTVHICQCFQNLLFKQTQDGSDLAYFLQLQIRPARALACVAQRNRESHSERQQCFGSREAAKHKEIRMKVLG